MSDIPSDECRCDGKLSDLDKMRFDYAWKWFAYHAEQRMKALNFMILTFGVLSAAAVAALDKGMQPFAFGLSLIAAMVAFLFSRLDARNEQLVEVGRKALAAIERSLAFADQDKLLPIDLVNKLYPKSDGGEERQKNGKENRQKKSETLFGNLLIGRHRVVIPAFAYLFIVLFLGFSIGAIIPPTKVKDKPILVLFGR